MTISRRHILSGLALGGIMAGMGESLLPELALAAESELGFGFAPSKPLFTKAEKALVSALCDRIVPKTDTPGAVEAGVPSFWEMMLVDFYSEKERVDTLSYLRALEAHAVVVHKKPFAKLKVAQQDALITDWMQGKIATVPSKSFYAARQIIVAGYYSSEIGAIQEMEYLAVPGTYNGAYPYAQVGKVFSGNP